MKNMIFKKSGLTALAIAMASAAIPAINAPLAAQEQSDILQLSIGSGDQINLNEAISDVFIADPAIADVEVKSTRQIYLFGLSPGETTFYATNAAGKIIYKRTIRVGNNINSIDQMLLLAMPNAKINVTTLNGITLLTGTVEQPEDAAEAERLVAAFSGEGVEIVSRLQTPTPLQVNLQVRIAEVSRSLSKALSNSFQGNNRGSFSATGTTDFSIDTSSENNNLNLAGSFLGLNFLSALEASENAGYVQTLASPNLTTTSGQTAVFNSGGSFPIPVSSGLGATTVEFQEFGVGLSYTPIVLSDGRISITLRTEVSDITTNGAVILNGFQVPAITQRVAETTVELGSGESFMIAGLLSNTSNSSVSKLPGIGDVPILGNLFKSDNWQKNQSELMIVITPYLVKPVNASDIKLPTDGYKAPDDLERIFLGKTNDSGDNSPRPGPMISGSGAIAPSISSGSQSNAQKNKRNAQKSNENKPNKKTAPGFSFGG